MFAWHLGLLFYPHTRVRFLIIVYPTAVDIKNGSSHDSHVQFQSLETSWSGFPQNSVPLPLFSPAFYLAELPTFLKEF